MWCVHAEKECKQTNKHENEMFYSIIQLRKQFWVNGHISGKLVLPVFTLYNSEG